jgi:hypothetical protein
MQTTQQIATASRHIICISTFMLLARLCRDRHRIEPSLLTGSGPFRAMECPK